MYIFSRDLKVAMYPSSTRLPTLLPYLPRLHLPSALLASTTRSVSGQISPTVGSAGLCGGLFILERGLPSGSLHLSKHPPAAALCSRPCTEPPTSSSSVRPSLARFSFACSFSTHLVSCQLLPCHFSLLVSSRLPLFSMVFSIYSAEVSNSKT